MARCKSGLWMPHNAFLNTPKMSLHHVQAHPNLTSQYHGNPSGSPNFYASASENCSRSPNFLNVVFKQYFYVQYLGQSLASRPQAQACRTLIETLCGTNKLTSWMKNTTSPIPEKEIPNAKFISNSLPGKALNSIPFCLLNNTNPGQSLFENFACV